MQRDIKLGVFSAFILLCFMLCFSQIDATRVSRVFCSILLRLPDCTWQQISVERYILKNLEFCYSRVSLASSVLAPTLKSIWYCVRSVFWSLVSSGISCAVMGLTWLAENLGVEDIVERQELWFWTSRVMYTFDLIHLLNLSACQCTHYALFRQ